MFWTGIRKLAGALRATPVAVASGRETLIIPLLALSEPDTMLASCPVPVTDDPEGASTEPSARSQDCNIAARAKA